jgi:hypothetical protein
MRSLIFAAVAALPLALCSVAVCAAQGDNQSRPGDAVRAACHADLAKLCSDSAPGGHSLFHCLRDHQDQLSDNCKAALANARTQFHGHAGWGSPPRSQN